MIKQDLIEQVAQATHYSAYDVKTIIDAAIGICKETLRKGEDIEIRTFGNFRITERAQKLVRNIGTGEEFYQPSHKVVKFIPGKDIKEL